jgi:hypothetical protein
LPVTLTPIGGSADGGTDALPGDGPQPDLAAGPEAGKPDARVTPDARIDEPGAEAATPDVPVPSDVVQPIDVKPSSDSLQLSDGADAGADVPQTTDVGQDAPLAADAVEAGADTGADSLAAFAWQPVENAQYDPQDPLGSSVGYPYALAVAVDPVREHVYVMWGDDSWAVRVRRWNHTTATWERTRTLEGNGSGYIRNVQIGVDGKGGVIAAWYYDFISTASDSTKEQMGGVWVSRSTDGDSWSAAESVTPQRPRVTQELSMAVARNGQARIAFSERLTSSPSTVQPYSAYFDGTTWTPGPKLALEDSTSQDNHYPSVAIGDDGSGIILFVQKDSSGYDSVAGSTFAGASANVDDFVILDSNTTYGLSYMDMAVAVNRSGQGVVVWGDSNGAMLRSYSPSTKTWTTARNIGNVGLYYPRVVAAEGGTVTVAWSQWVDTSYNVWTLEGTVSGNWTAPLPLEQDNLSIPNNQYASETTETLPYPSLAVDGAGNVLALWLKKTKDTPTHEFAVEARRKLAGKANDWQPTTELARKSVLVPVWPSLAVGDYGLGAASYFWANPGTNSLPDSHTVFVSLFR